jgi:hypothetical protein
MYSQKREEEKEATPDVTSTMTHKEPTGSPPIPNENCERTPSTSKLLLEMEDPKNEPCFAAHLRRNKSLKGVAAVKEKNPNPLNPG